MFDVNTIFKLRMGVSQCDHVFYIGVPTFKGNNVLKLHGDPFEKLLNFQNFQNHLNR